MAKKGSFELVESVNSIGLSSAEFDNSNIVTYFVPPGDTPIDRFHVGWYRYGDTSDNGFALGPSLPMHVGYIGNGSEEFKFGNTYVFSVKVYSTHEGHANISKWRRIKGNIARTFDEPIVGTEGIPTVKPEEKPKVEWIIPVLHQMM